MLLNFDIVDYIGNTLGLAFNKPRNYGEVIHCIAKTQIMSFKGNTTFHALILTTINPHSYKQLTTARKILCFSSKKVSK